MSTEKQSADKHPIISSFEMREKLAERGRHIPLINARSGLPRLDMAIENFQDGELIAVSGPTKNGKTLLCQTLTHNFAEQQIYSLWFSYEVHPRQFLECFEHDNLPLMYMPDGLEAKSMKWLEEKILQSFNQYGTRVVFIDHLHYLFDIAVGRQNTSLTIGSIIRQLKLLAVKHRFLIFLLCHTTKPGGEGSDLSYNSIRDSSFVSQESDSVFLIQRTGDAESQMSVEFHRRTGVFQKRIKLIKVGKYLYERTQDED